MREPELDRVFNWVGEDLDRAVLWKAYATGYLAASDWGAEHSLPAAAAEFLYWVQLREAGL